MALRIRALLILTAALAAAAVLLSFGPATQQAAAARSCNISGEERELGATYVTSLKVRRVGCAKGKRVVKAYHRCRFSVGGRDGRCGRRVSGGWSCSDRRFNRISTQYDAKATCKKGRARVWHAYTQFT